MTLWPRKIKRRWSQVFFTFFVCRLSTALGRSCERTPLHLGHLNAFEEHYYFLIHSSISISDNPCCRNFSRIRASRWLCSESCWLCSESCWFCCNIYWSFSLITLSRLIMAVSRSSIAWKYSSSTFMSWRSCASEEAMSSRWRMYCISASSW